jgi:hypothetical protein
MILKDSVNLHFLKSELNLQHTDFQSDLCNPLSAVNNRFINSLLFHQLWISLGFVWYYWVLAGKVTGNVKEFDNQTSYCDCHSFTRGGDFRGGLCDYSKGTEDAESAGDGFQGKDGGVVPV